MRIQRVFLVFLVGAIAALGLVLISNPASVYADECTWMGYGDDVWSDPSNWSCGFVPDDDDTVILETGELNLDSDVTVLELDQSGGYLQGSYNLTVTEAFNWTGGRQAGTGTTIIAPGASSIINESSLYVTVDGRTLENRGHLVWSNGDIMMRDGAIINNWGVFEIEAEADLHDWGIYVQPIFWNREGGTLRRVTDTGATEVRVDFYNDGVVQVSSGMLRLITFDVVGSNSGEYYAGAGATLEFCGGNHTLATGSLVHGDGRVLFSGATVTVLGTYSVSGTTEVSGGTVTVDPSAVVTSMSGVLIVSGGTADLSNGVPVTVQSLEQTGVAHFTGTGVVQVTEQYTWTGGWLHGPGSTIIDEGAMLTISGGSAKYLYGRLVENRGTATLSGGILLLDGATIDNRGQLDLDAGMSLNGVTGEESSLWNRGTLRKVNAEGSSLLWMHTINEGLIEVQAGRLQLSETEGTSNSGEYSVWLDGELEFTAGSQTLLPGSRVYGEGLVWVNGSAAVTVQGNYDLSGVTALTEGSLRFDVPGSTGGFLQLGGTLTGEGTVTVTDAFLWQGGMQLGPGKTLIADRASAVIERGTYVKALDGRALENWGDLVWLDGTFDVDNGATIENWGVFEIQAGLYLHGSGEMSTFWNRDGGVLRKEGVESDTWIQIDFYNAGLVEVSAGELRFAGTDAMSSSNGEFYVAYDGLLNFDFGIHTLEFFSLVHGEGTVEFGGADVTVLGDYDVGGLTRVTYGTVTFDDARSVAFGDLFHSGGALSVDTEATISGDFDRRFGLFNTGTGMFTFNGTEEQMITGSSPIHFYNLGIDSGATVVFPSGSLEPTVEGTLTNNGTMVQTLEVDNSGGSGAATFSFLNIEDEGGVDKYYGLDITIGAYANMGTTQVSIQGNQTCGSTNTVQRCYEIDPQYVTPSTVRFYYREQEANSNTAPYVWHWNGSSWDNVDLVPLRDTADPEGYWVEADGISSYSPFALSDEEPLPEYEGIIFVKSITLKFQPNGQIAGTVRIIDDDNNGVAGASVSVVWTGPEGFYKEQTAQTTKPGTARFRVKVQDSGTYTLSVVNVSLDGWLYDPEQNQETWESINVQID